MEIRDYSKIREENIEIRANSALEKEMNRGVDFDHPYWQLFDIKDALNTTIVNAYRMGFKEGFKRAQDE